MDRLNNLEIKRELLEGKKIHDYFLHMNSAYDNKQWTEKGRIQSYNRYLEYLEKLTKSIKIELR